MSHINAEPGRSTARARDTWRGLWGRGGEPPAPHRIPELRHQLGGSRGHDECVVCLRLIEIIQRWLAELPRGAADGTGLPDRLVYCPRHCPLLLADANGRDYLGVLLPSLLRAELRRLADAGPPAADARCPACQLEHDAQSAAVHAAACAPRAETDELPSLARLALCHRHAIMVAARMVGALGPEPRVIPDVRLVLALHRRRLAHLAGYEPRRDADQIVAGRLPYAPPPAESADDICPVCGTATEATRRLLGGWATSLATRSDARAQAPTLCPVHLGELLRLGDGFTIAALAAAELAQLGSALDVLDSQTPHPHAVRHAVTALGARHACPACAVSREAERHVLAIMLLTGPEIPAAALVCARHARALPTGHPARVELITKLGAITESAQRIEPQRGLGLLDGRVASCAMGGGEPRWA